MNQLCDIFCRCFRWLHRFRKRCGYGIHSPFAFNLVTGVIYESWPYYAYEQLRGLRIKSNVVLRVKDDCLLFRLVNNCQPRTGLLVSDKLGISQNYLQSGCSSTSWFSLRPDELSNLEELLHNHGNLDFLYVDDPCHTQSILDSVLPFINDRTLFVIRGIRHNSAIFTIWKQFIELPEVRVTFDLHDFGLIYFKKRLNKENYIINYF